MLFGPRPRTTQPHILPQSWGYTGNTLPARAAIVHNTLTPVPAVPAEDVAQFTPGNYPFLAFAPDAPWFVNTSMLQAIEFALDYHVTESRLTDFGLVIQAPNTYRRAPTVERVLIMPLPAQSTDPTVLVTRTAHLCLGPDHRGFATSGLHQPGDLLPRPARLHVPRGASSEVRTGEAISRALHHGLHRRGPGLCLLHAAVGVAQQVPPRLGTGGRHQRPASSSTLAPWNVSARGRTYPERLPTEVKGREGYVIIM